MYFFIFLVRMRRNFSLSQLSLCREDRETPRSPHWLLLWPGCDLNPGREAEEGREGGTEQHQGLQPKGSSPWVKEVLEVVPSSL